MLTGNIYIFHLCLFVSIVAPYIVIYFFKNSWEKIPVFYGIFIFYIILSSWALHFFKLLSPYTWRICSISFLFLLLWLLWEKRNALPFELKKPGRTYTLSDYSIAYLIIFWIVISYFRAVSLPILLSDSRTMHLYQQALYFQEHSFPFHNTNSWESAFRPINGLIWNMFFSTFLEDNKLIEIPQLISWLALIFISYSIFSLLKIDKKLAGIVILSISFSPRVLSLSTNNLIDLPSLLYFSGVVYFFLKINKNKELKMLDLIMFGTYCGAYLGSRIQGLIFVPLIMACILSIFFRKRLITTKRVLVPIALTLVLGIGKYIQNFAFYESPIPVNINSSNSLSYKIFFDNLKILTNIILDRSWNFYGVIPFHPNSSIIGFPINFIIFPFAIFGCLNKKYRNSYKSSFSIFVIGLIFIIIAMFSLKSPSPNYLSRLWFPFFYTTIIYGTVIINSLLEEKKIKSVLAVFAFTIFLSVIFYGGLYRKTLAIILILTSFYVLKEKSINSQFLINFIFFFVMMISVLYATMNILYDSSSQLLNYKKINREYDQSVLPNLSKYFKQGDRVGILNLNREIRFPIYDLFGEKHAIKARLVFDWRDQINLKKLYDDELLMKFDYLILSNLDYNKISEFKNFLKIEKFDHFFIYKNKNSYTKKI